MNDLSIFYPILQLAFIVLSLICIAAFIYGLRQVLPKVEPDPKSRRKLNYIFSIILISWFLLVIGLSGIGWFEDFSVFPSPVVPFVWLPFFVVLFLLPSKKLGRILAVVPPQYLIYFQSFRIIVEILLWGLFELDLIPIQMTFEGRNFDILVGLTAPFVAHCCFVKKSWPKQVAIIWNIGGLILLFNIIMISILSIPGPIRVFMNEPANTIIGQFPFTLLPSVLVATAYTLHFFSLKQLLFHKK